jgi:hypothetical protein
MPLQIGKQQTVVLLSGCPAHCPETPRKLQTTYWKLPMLAFGVSLGHLSALNSVEMKERASCKRIGISSASTPWVHWQNR